MVTLHLFCLVVALPFIVLVYGQERRRDEIPAETEDLTEKTLLSSERGWIGCLYNPKVCEDDERCYDDKLFGICRSKDAGMSASMLLYSYKDLNTEWKLLLISELTKLAEQGFKWTDVFTQCILRSTLLAYKTSSFQDATLCGIGLEKDVSDYRPTDVEEEEDVEEPRSNFLANIETRHDALRRMENEVAKEKRDAALRLHKYFANKAVPEDEDYVTDYDLEKFRRQMSKLERIQEDAESSLDRDTVNDLKPDETKNDDLTLVSTLVRNKVGNRQKKRSQGLGHARMRSYAENVSPEEALGQLNPSKREEEHHNDLTNAEMMRQLAEEEADAEEELAAMTTPKPKKIVDSRWVFVAIGWPKGRPQTFRSSGEVKEFLDALEKAIGLPAPVYERFEYSDREVAFRLTKPYQENPQAIVDLLNNVTHPVEDGPVILESGLGRKTRKVPASRLAPRPKHFGVTFAVCGAVLFIIVAVMIVFFMQRYRISKSKVYSLTKSAEQGESREAYQDLCRHRMQSKSSEKPEPVSAAARAVGPALTRGDSNSAGSTRSSTSSWSEEPIHSNMDISTGHLILSYMEEHLNNKEKLESEWNNLCAYQPDCVKCDSGKREENLNRNRYLDNIPYDNNRVELKTAFEGSNYFNASFVINHDPKNPVYIATQGPLANTAAQFWQMVWEQGSIVIVNLTRLVEDGISLCQKYWPEEGSELYNNYEVHLVSEHVWCEDYLVRSFYLKNVSSGETRTVTQFHFLSWPDLGEPSAVKTLLDFRRKVNKSYKGRSCPVIVHCSDGCGRSGTYILLDMVLNRLAKGVKQIDISAAVEHLRDQRCQMVKTKGQFEFVLTAIAEEVHAMLKSLPQ